MGEALPNVGRAINFVVTARDQRPDGGTITTDNVQLTVAPDTGPFVVRTQNATDSTALWITGPRLAWGKCASPCQLMGGRRLGRCWPPRCPTPARPPSRCPA
ncbi:MAG: hypothetical protein WKG07_16815 [Hymenobacter sp.]